MLTKAMQDVIAERKRQIEVEGWTPEHDDEHELRDLSDAAGCYALFCNSHPDGETPSLWPWENKWWKPSSDPRRNMVKAGALILAAIEQWDRRVKPEAQEGE